MHQISCSAVLMVPRSSFAERAVHELRNAGRMALPSLLGIPGGVRVSRKACSHE